MDPDTADLVRQLCTRIRMIMEPRRLSPCSTAPELNPPERLVHAGRAITTLVEAAKVLSRTL